MNEAPTIRAIARAVGLSRTTVSVALNGGGRVGSENRRRIHEAAQAMGYRLNPLTHAIMSEVRHSRVRTFRGLLAAVDFIEHDRPPVAPPYHAEIFRGAAERAEALGFSLEIFRIGAGLSVRRLNSILRARDIRGILVLPTWQAADLSELDWSERAGIYADYAFESPPLPSVCPDHMRALAEMFRRLDALGYRRPGLLLNSHLDHRIEHRWEAAYLGLTSDLPRMAKDIPIMKSERLDRAAFAAWFRQHQPDIVIGHATEIVRWMESAGASVPASHGFASLNVCTAGGPCAGLDLRPAFIGSLAVEQLVSRLRRNEIGLNRPLFGVTVPPRWVDGPTVRRL